MPPKVRFQQQNIVDAAYELARKQGLDAINARSVAGEIGCSTQPIFRVFESMDQLKACVMEKAIQRFSNYITVNQSNSGSPYKSIGMAYLQFATEEPQLFHMVFLCQHEHRLPEMDAFACKDRVIQVLIDKSGFTRLEAEAIHQHMWIYTYGLAALLATGQLRFTSDELSELLNMEYRAVVATLLCEEAKQYKPPA